MFETNTTFGGRVDGRRRRVKQDIQLLFLYDIFENLAVFEMKITMHIVLQCINTQFANVGTEAPNKLIRNSITQILEYEIGIWFIQWRMVVTNGFDIENAIDSPGEFL
jgi:hypothetical protein